MRVHSCLNSLFAGLDAEHRAIVTLAEVSLKALFGSQVPPCG